MRQTKQTEKEAGTGRRSEPQIRLVLGMTSGASFSAQTRKGGPELKSDHEKRRRLAYVARRYYLDDQKQSDIAAELGISRPMVSRLLTEARQLGVVEITVHDPEVKAASLLERLRAGSSIKDGILVEDGAGDAFTNQLLSQGAVELRSSCRAAVWVWAGGHLIGQLVTWLEKIPRHGSSVTDICPLVGECQHSCPQLPVQRKCPPYGPAAGSLPAFSLPARPAGKPGGETDPSAPRKSTGRSMRNGSGSTPPW